MENQVIGILHPEHLHLVDELGKSFLGCEQEWYTSLWQRRAGCGPTVASNLMLYLHRRGAIRLPFALSDKAGYLDLMNAMWNFVTPTIRGVNTVERFSDGLHAFGRNYGLSLDCACLKYPKKAHERPSFREVVGFLAEGLAMDCPIGFLNLSNGDVSDLDAWHWVTLVCLEVTDNGERAFVEYYDGNRTAVIDLRTWCDTTRENGGFVHFRHLEQPL